MVDFRSPRSQAQDVAPMIAAIAFLVGFSCVVIAATHEGATESAKWWTVTSIATLTLTLASATMYYPGSHAALAIVLIASISGLFIIAGGTALLLHFATLDVSSGLQMAGIASYLGGSLAGWLAWTSKAIREIRDRRKSD